MKISIQNMNFKGYDAAPLRALHLNCNQTSPFLHELRQIGANEGFKIQENHEISPYTEEQYKKDAKWAQDFKMIIEKDEKPFIVASHSVPLEYLEGTQATLGIPYQINRFIATGGNTFIGKYPNGEKWMLVGESELKTKSKEFLFEEYGVKPENIFEIPQQYYHLDMFMRPIGYPYVLVNNPKLSEKKISSLEISKNPYEVIMLQKEYREFEQERKKHYKPQKDVIKSLKKAGFVPIEIAGVFGSGINFMNAIVNQHEDGSISYITNSSSCPSLLISSFQEDFEKELRKKVPNIRNVYFVGGIKELETQMSNYMMENLSRRGGGIHCMTMEEPNFQAWG